MYMLDTNIIIFSMRHPDSACAAELTNHLGKDVCISAVTFAELVYGIENSSRPEQNRTAVQIMLSGIRISPFDMAAAENFGLLLAERKRKGSYQPAHDRDRMIAAHARSRGDTLVTDNIKDFQDVPGLTVTTWREAGDL